MVCVCGARLPVDNRYSCCDSCLNMEDFEQADEYFNHYDYWE